MIQADSSAFVCIIRAWHVADVTFLRDNWDADAPKTRGIRCLLCGCNVEHPECLMAVNRLVVGSSPTGGAS